MTSFRLLLGVWLVIAAGSLPARADAEAEPQGLWERDTLTGDWGGLRTRLIDQGVTLGLLEQSELWGNTTGGLRTGVVYNGLTTASVRLDLDKLAGWSGATFYASVFQIHGRGPSLNLVGNLQVVSNIEATRSEKLYNIWIEQVLLGGRLNLRIGQEGANDEMMLPKYGAMFINSSFGYPALLAFDLPSGGPNYPIAAPMVRARYQFTDEFTIVAAAFDGDPAGPGRGDPQLRDRTGTAFRLRDNLLAFLELWYSAGTPEGLPGTYKLGGWYHAGRFADQYDDSAGRPLASPASNGVALQHRTDHAVYGVVDQMLWRPADSQDRGLAMFALAMGAPDDRNMSDLYIEGGLNWAGPFADRPDDVAGLAFGYARVSDSLRRFGNASIAFTGAGYPYRNHETIIELTYQYQVAPWWTLQPDIQYVINPGAALPNAAGVQSAPLKNAIVAGVRAAITF